MFFKRFPVACSFAQWYLCYSSGTSHCLTPPLLQAAALPHRNDSNLSSTLIHGNFTAAQTVQALTQLHAQPQT